ncbi:MAG: hypothetical protein K0R25_332 [Rickettsiaceae bacterium]|jgi:para-aminobenzoate synthetase component 1|nr:hypothetical protein [Rickettsiaceae bacterium]
MPKKLKLNWLNPLDLAYKISISDYKQNWVFLYSGLNKKIRNSKSYIGLYPQKEIISDNFNELEDVIQNSQDQWLGYLSYNLKNQLENLKTDKKSLLNPPDLWMINFGLMLEFDHDKKCINIIKNSCDSDLEKIQKIISIKAKTGPKIIESASIAGSNFSKKQYLEKVKITQNHIADGDIYQANLTRKFFGKLKVKNKFEIFLKLTEASPANYSSFLKFEKYQIISSSPELFLKIDGKNNVLSSPIKGTAPKLKNKKLDQKSKYDLQNSQKEQAENLMIVDLVRNDFSRYCKPGSVQVKNLFKISSYKTLHHLSSDICGVKKPDVSNLSVIKSCFPAGSMTGAPKIKAMEICSELEKQARGIYSGAIGFVGKKECELSVVIRTLVVEDDKFEFQVGGAITFDSDPEKEWQESLNKARGIAKTLGIRLSDLRRI